jgi:hypothetical protein
MKEVHVWRFIPADHRLGYGDGREVREGETLTVDGEIGLCARGIHGSEKLTDALRYKRSPVLTMAVLSGDIASDDEKCCASVCRTDRILTREETDRFLRLFAVRCARRVLDVADEKHRATLENTLDVAERYALGDATENDLTTARAAASAAASAAARDAEWAARDEQERIANELWVELFEKMGAE